MFFHFEGNAHVPNVELRLGTNFPLHSLMMKLDLPTAASPASTILYILSGSREALEEPMDWKENQNAMWYLRPRIYEISVLDRKYGFKFYLSEKEGASISKGGRVDLREGRSRWNSNLPLGLLSFDEDDCFCSREIWDWHEKIWCLVHLAEFAAAALDCHWGTPTQPRFHHEIPVPFNKKTSTWNSYSIFLYNG